MSVNPVKIRTYDQVVEDAKETLFDIKKEFDNSKEYYFDYEQAYKYIKFVAMLRHTAGEFAGKNFQLLPFQVKFIAQSLCVKSIETKKRRYKTAILHVPRKQGKSELMGALINLMYFIDKEIAKEIYCIAAETTQAQIVYNVATSMLRQTNYFEKFVNIYRSTKTVESKGEFRDILRVLSSQAGTKDGLRCNVLISDEAHAYRDDSLFKVVEESMVSRTEPITFMISTAGYNLEGFYYQKLEYARKVNKGIIKDDSMFAMIFEADPKKWKDEQEWIKANPALGYGVKIENLRDLFIKACHSGEEEVSFKTKFLNIWTNSSETFIPDHTWQENMGKITDSELSSYPCYGGLDLSSVSDLTSFYLIFDAGDKLIIRGKNYLPEENIRKKAKNDEVPYQSWERDGFLTLTHGNVINYDWIQADIEKACEMYNVKMIAYDRWNSSQLVTKLTDKKVPLATMGMGFASMNAPCKEFEKRALEKKFLTDDPVLRWAISNIIVVRDPAGNIKFDKGRGKSKIDPAVALVMALGAYIPFMNKKTVYEERGMRSL